jgi:hypothetical protein
VDNKYGSSLSDVLMRFMGRLGRGYGKILEGALEIFFCHTGFEVRDRSKIRFWHDLWCGDRAFKEYIFFFDK